MGIEQKKENPGSGESWAKSAAGENREKPSDKAPQYSQFPKKSSGNAKAKTPQQKWRERNPKADWAHNATRSAKRRGLVTQEPCAVCGSPDSEAHHENYDRPLDLVWLCRRHHKALHSGGSRGA